MPTANEQKIKHQEKAEKIRDLISKAEQNRNYSLNVREDFFTLLTNIGGVMTTSQAQDVLKFIDGNRTPVQTYKAERFLYPEIAAKRLTVDRDRKLVYEGPRCDIAYDPAILWGFTYIIKNAKSVDDILSAVAVGGANRSISFTAQGEYQKILFANHGTVDVLGRQIYANEQALLKTPLNPDMIRPLYVIFLTETDKKAVDATFERLADLDIKFNHRIVVPHGDWVDNQIGFTEYEVAPESD